MVAEGGRARASRGGLTMERQTVALPDGRSQQVVRGGSGPTIVWLHGVHGVQPHDPVIARLAQRHTVIAPIAPGFNAVEEIDEIRDVHDLALAYDDLFEALGLARVRLVGHSFGAMVAAEVAAHVPKRVERLALLSPVGLWRDDLPVADLFARPYTAIDALLWAEGRPSGPMATSVADATQIESLVTIAQGMSAVAKFLWPIPEKGLGRRLYRVECETLVVFGEKDAFVPAAYATEFTSRLRRARAAVIPGAGHMAPYERETAVLDLIEGFLR